MVRSSRAREAAKLSTAMAGTRCVHALAKCHVIDAGTIQGQIDSRASLSSIAVASDAESRMMATVS
jgi:hypothetical protein